MSVAVLRDPTRTPEVGSESVESRFEYPGIPTTCDGAEAVVHVEIQVTQAAGAYPITSSTTMGGGYNAAVMNGQTNLWGDLLIFFEPESEHSAATVCEGFAVAGGRVTNFTSGQGLVLMKEVLYTISGKRLPVVMNIGRGASPATLSMCMPDMTMSCRSPTWAGACCSRAMPKKRAIFASLAVAPPRTRKRHFSACKTAFSRRTPWKPCV